MKSILVFYFVLVLACCNSNPPIEIVSNEFEIICGDRIVKVSEFAIHNNTPEVVYSWLDYDYLREMNGPKEVLSYFFTPRGDFSLADLLTENNILFRDFKPIVGSTLLIKVLPRQSFKYIGINNPDLLQHIFYLKESDLLSLIGQILNKSILYNEDYIVIPYDQSDYDSFDDYADTVKRGQN